MSAHRPSRVARSSSTMATRIGESGCRSGNVAFICATPIAQAPILRNSIIMLPSFQRNHQRDAAPRARRGNNIDDAAQLRRAVAHILQAMPVEGTLGGKETATVVADLAAELAVCDRQAEPD